MHSVKQIVLRSLAVTSAVGLVSALALAAPSSASATGEEAPPAYTGADTSQPGAEVTAQDDDQVVTYGGGPPLAEAVVSTVKGRSTNDGGCAFRLPDLELAPGETVIHARQIETDFSDCTTKVETGIPEDQQELPDDGTFERESATPTERAGGTDEAGVAATSSSGFYRVYWEDVVNIKVHEVKSNISWTWDGACVSSSNGSADYWWRSGTGWGKDSSGSWITRSCGSSLVYTNATYDNGAFCWPGTVWSYYNEVRVRGRADGYLLGAVIDTWTTYPFACPTLHYHTELKRVTG